MDFLWVSTSVSWARRFVNWLLSDGEDPFDCMCCVCKGKPFDKDCPCLFCRRRLEPPETGGPVLKTAADFYTAPEQCTRCGGEDLFLYNVNAPFNVRPSYAWCCGDCYVTQGSLVTSPTGP